MRNNASPARFLRSPKNNLQLDGYPTFYPEGQISNSPGADTNPQPALPINATTDDPIGWWSHTQPDGVGGPDLILNSIVCISHQYHISLKVAANMLESEL